jgi:hypothetical protein
VRDGLTPIVQRLLALLPMHPVQLIWAPARAIRWHFPSVTLQPLPLGSPFTSAACQCDGYYEPILTPGRPWILYRDDVSTERVRFTLLHELGHHLICAVDPSLYDQIDAVAGASGDPAEVEERVCQRFAATLLISDKLLDHVIGAAHPTVAHVQALRRLSPASWQAVAVRVAQRLPAPGAVVLVRSPGRVAFVATSPELYGMWLAHSRVAPGGVLDRALHQAAYNVPDIFAWDRPGARSLWCSARPVHSGLAVAIMSTRQVPAADHDPTPAEVSAVLPAVVRQPDAEFDDPVPVGELLEGTLEQPAGAAVGLGTPHDTTPAVAPDGPGRPMSLEQVRAALRPRSLTVLASRPSHGKSALALGLAADMARTRGTRVALACLEMSNNEVARRLVAATASVDQHRLRTGRLDDSDWARLTRHLGALADLNITFIPTRLGLSLTDLVEHCLKLTQRGRLELLVVDSIQLLTAEPEAAGMFCDPHEVLARLKHLAIELDLAVIVVSQLSRRAEERGDQLPELTDLPEYRAAVQVADFIGLLHTRGLVRPWAHDDTRAAELLVVRHRFGPTGVVDLRFDYEFCRLSAPRSSPGQPTGPDSPRPRRTSDRTRRATATRAAFA